MNKRTILIVDNDSLIANVYQVKFRNEGYEAEVVGDGPGALEMLRTTAVDLVLLELSLPGMNGVDLIKNIRSGDQTKELPVIVLSNTYMTGLVQAAWKAGATRCLSKANCTPREMLDIVGKVFATRGTEGKAGAAQAVAASLGPSVVAPAAPSMAAPARLVIAPPNGHAMTVSAPFAFTAPNGSAVAAPARASGAPPAQAEVELQIRMVGAFLTGAPQTIALLREHYRAFTKCEEEHLRLAELYELYRLSRSLTGSAGLIGFREIAQTASALEALLKELHPRPSEITPSAVRTIAQAVDVLAILVAHAGGPQQELVEPPMILMVDDESISREMISSALKKVGLHAISLDNSTLALQVLEQNHFGLIFLDVEMPAPNGIELCERIRKMPTNRDTPVVFVTAHSDFEIRERSSLSGGNDFIAKPFLLLELAVKALTWLRKKDPLVP